MGQTFLYRAAERGGTVTRGRLAAETREAAAAALADRGLFPIELRPEPPSLVRSPRMAAAEAAQGLRVLATLLESGLPMGRALAAFDELAPVSWRAGLAEIREAIRAGTSLSSSLDVARLGLPASVLGIIRAGESGGALAASVGYAAELMEGQAATRAAIRNALAYPMMLGAAGAASLALLVGIVLPRFAALLADLGQALPPTTRFVLASATLARRAALPAVLLMVAALGILSMWTRTASGARRWCELLLGLPVIGAIRHASASARACSALAALLESGVPIATALPYAASTTADAAISARLAAVRESVIRGEGLARAIDAHRALTSVAVRFIRAGEESGRVAPMLARAARVESDRAQRLVRGLVRVLEPGLILGFGGIVALVAAALLQAMYGVRVTP